MTHIVCRTRVKDYTIWRAVFDSHKQAHRDAGLMLANVWRSIDEPNNVFFVFEVKDIGRANQFINSPDSVRAGAESGVIDGEYHFVENEPSY